LDAISVPASAVEFAAALAAIKSAKVVGFDTESKPTFAKGEVSTGPHIVQLATANHCYLFQVHNAVGLPVLLELLQSKAVLKVGFGLSSDREQIQSKLGVELAGVLDLDTVFRKLGYRNTAGVRAAVAIVLNQKFHKSKRVSTSNWGLSVLQSRQLLYAANDAYAALKVWEKLPQG
jgi:ribonuclease D